MCRSGLWTVDAGRRRDVGGGDLAGALLAQVHDDRLVALGADDEFLEVQDDVGDVFLDALDGRELVQHAVDADAGDRRARDGRQQGAAQRVAERVAEAGLERLDDEARPVVGDRLLGRGWGAERSAQCCSLIRGRPLYDARRCARRHSEVAARWCLLRVELDDQLFLDRDVDLRALGQRVHEDAQPVRDDLQPGRHRPLAVGLPGDQERRGLQRLRLDVDDVVLA